MNVELLPCPFCGGQGEVIPAEPNEITRVHCTRCDAEASPRTDEDEAIEYRNMRRSFLFICGHVFPWYDKEPPRYCPYCGSRAVVRDE